MEPFFSPKRIRIISTPPPLQCWNSEGRLAQLDIMLTFWLLSTRLNLSRPADLTYLHLFELYHVTMRLYGQEIYLPRVNIFRKKLEKILSVIVCRVSLSFSWVIANFVPIVPQGKIRVKCLACKFRSTGENCSETWWNVLLMFILQFTGKMAARNLTRGLFWSDSCRGFHACRGIRGVGFKCSSPDSRGFRRSRCFQRERQTTPFLNPLPALWAKLAQGNQKSLANAIFSAATKKGQYVFLLWTSLRYPSLRWKSATKWRCAILVNSGLYPHLPITEHDLPKQFWNEFLANSLQNCRNKLLSCICNALLSVSVVWGCFLFCAFQGYFQNSLKECYGCASHETVRQKETCGHVYSMFLTISLTMMVLLWHLLDAWRWAIKHSLEKRPFRRGHRGGALIGESLRDDTIGATGPRASEREICLWEGNLRGSQRGRFCRDFSEVFRGFKRFLRGFQRFLRGFQRSSQRPSQRQTSLSEALGPVAPIRVVP